MGTCFLGGEVGGKQGRKEGERGRRVVGRALMVQVATGERASITVFFSIGLMPAFLAAVTDSKYAFYVDVTQWSVRHSWVSGRVAFEVFARVRITFV